MVTFRVGDTIHLNYEGFELESNILIDDCFLKSQYDQWSYNRCTKLVIKNINSKYLVDINTTKPITIDHSNIKFLKISSLYIKLYNSCINYMALYNIVKIEHLSLDGCTVYGEIDFNFIQDVFLQNTMISSIRGIYI